MSSYSKSDQAIARDLGERLQRIRLNRNITQDELATKIGVSKPTIVQLEKGQGKLITLIGVMRALGMLDQIDILMPDVLVSPLQMAKMQGKRRVRASSSQGAARTGKAEKSVGGSDTVVKTSSGENRVGPRITRSRRRNRSTF